MSAQRASTFRSALDALLARIDCDEVVELTRSLVRIPSVYRPDDPDAKEYPVRDHENAIHTAALKVVEAMDGYAGELKVPGVLALALLNLRNAVKRGSGP